MFQKLKVFWCSVILFSCQLLVSANYANSTISGFKAISDDFRIFQQTGKPIGRRDGRKLVSFNTKNDNIEVKEPSDKKCDHSILIGAQIEFSSHFSYNLLRSEKKCPKTKVSFQNGAHMTNRICVSLSNLVWGTWGIKWKSGTAAVMKIKRKKAFVHLKDFVSLLSLNTCEFSAQCTLGTRYGAVSFSVSDSVGGDAASAAAADTFRWCYCHCDVSFTPLNRVKLVQLATHMMALWSLSKITCIITSFQLKLLTRLKSSYLNINWLNLSFVFIWVFNLFSFEQICQLESDDKANVLRYLIWYAMLHDFEPLNLHVASCVFFFGRSVSNFQFRLYRFRWNVLSIRLEILLRIQKHLYR